MPDEKCEQDKRSLLDTLKEGNKKQVSIIYTVPNQVPSTSVNAQGYVDGEETAMEKHPTKILVKKFECQVCHKYFSTNFNLKKHLRVVHNYSFESKTQFICSECKSSFKSSIFFKSHLTEIHQFPEECEKLRFANKEDFDAWKLHVEESTSSKFIKLKMTLSGYSKFTCNRNRYGKSMGKPEVKYYCPAGIYASSKKQGNVFSIDVSYCSLHLGHQCELKTIPRNFKCPQCSKGFASNKTLRKHTKLVHHSNNHPNNKKGLICSDCKASFKSRLYFMSHIEKDHELVAEIQNLIFDKKEDFEEWKSSVEKDTMTKFIIAKTYKTTSGNDTINFACHRNGQYKSKGTGQRQIKLIGTNKIQFFCPANIVTKSKEPGKPFPIDVNYCSLHLGHEHELKRITLDKQEKCNIAAQIISGVPRKQILQRIAEYANPTERLSIANMQDLRNIATSYGIKDMLESKEVAEEIEKAQGDFFSNFCVDDCLEVEIPLVYEQNEPVANASQLP